MFGCKSAHLLYYVAVGLSLLYQGHAVHIGTNIVRALQVACVIPPECRLQTALNLEGREDECVYALRK
jgi:hypothetical protein